MPELPKEQFLKGFRIDETDLYKLEEINPRNLQGKLKKINTKEKAENRLSESNKMSSFSLDRKISLNPIKEQIIKNALRKKKKSSDFLETLNVFPVKLMPPIKPSQNPFLEKRKELLGIKYKLTKKKIYI